MSEPGIPRTLPSTRPRRLHEAGARLAARTTFEWADGADGFYGLSREGLRGLVAELGESLGMLPAQADRIEVCFADHRPVRRGRFVPPHYNYAAVEVRFDHDGRVAGVTVIINRSLELIQHVSRKAAANASPADARPRFELQTPQQGVRSLLTEELHHALTFLKAGQRGRIGRWHDRFAAQLAAKGAQRTGHDADIFEVAASNVVARGLAKDAVERGDLPAAASLRALLESGQREMRHTLFMLDRIEPRGQMFCPTGFSPDADEGR